MFWNPEVITTTGKSLRITQIQFNIIYIMRTVIAVIDKTKRYPITIRKIHEKKTNKSSR